MKNLIIDTDIFSDVDDAGALLLACTLPESNLLAVNVNETSRYSALAVSGILGHYGRGHVPVGIRRPLSDAVFFDSRNFVAGEFVSKVAYHFRHSGGSLDWDRRAEDAWDPVRLYRKVLSEAEDGSVTVVSIGFLDNLSALLSSPPDTFFPLPGPALVARKVSHLVIQGGNYPPSQSSSNPNPANVSRPLRPAWNFSGPNASHAPAAAHVISAWPGRITFLGRDVGVNVLTGGPLMQPFLNGEPWRRDPVRMAYLWYTYGGLFTEEGKVKARPAWDPLVVLYAVKGIECGLFEEVGGKGRKGWNVMDEKEGWNRWVWEDEFGKDGADGAKRPNGEHMFLRLKVKPEEAAKVIDELFLEGVRAGYLRSSVKEDSRL